MIQKRVKKGPYGLETVSYRQLCDNCRASLPKVHTAKCHRCGASRPFMVVEYGEAKEQWTDVVLAMDVNMIHSGQNVSVRLPRYNFGQSRKTMKGSNQEVKRIRNLLIAHGVSFSETGAAVISFVIPCQDNQNVTMWIDTRGHGIRITTTTSECEFEVRNRKLYISTSQSVTRAAALAHAFSA